MNKQNFNTADWLPVTAKDLKYRLWDTVDVVLFTGDAYIDHPAFGAAVIGRVLEAEGLKVAIVPQPNWQDDLRDFRKFGRPNLFFAVTAGNMDSMVNHYTANKRLRSNDAYSPGGKAGFRPDYPTIVYSRILKKLYADVPVIIGGIEASLRRVTHFDYWQDKLKPSILHESHADLLVYGMGEKPVVEIARLMKRGVPFNNMHNIAQTAIIVDDNQNIPQVKKWKNLSLHSHNTCLNNKRKLAENFRIIETESNAVNAHRLLQKIESEKGDKTLIINPPYNQTSEKEIDTVYDLPYTRLPHPKYAKKGAIPAFEMIKHSVNIHRGCFGGCSFCTISAHQGKFIVSRSKKSILSEVEKIKNMPGFIGHITDLGGPSANMYKMQGKEKHICDSCSRASCIYPVICKNLNTSHNELNELYTLIRKTDGISKVSIGSGIRYDLFFDNSDEITDSNKLKYVEGLIRHHVSGRLKVAPEHTENTVLDTMRKPQFGLFFKFKKVFDKINQQFGLKQQLIPYFISSHPNCQTADMAELAAKTKSLNFKLEQIQDFTPTPMTLSAVMYYSGYNPFTGKTVKTAQTKQEKLLQRLFFFWYKKESRKAIISELRKINRKDLIDKLLR